MPRDGAVTRERILAVAERLVIENGFAATSVDQVLAESGTSKGSFFHHFPTKLDLARSLVERYVAADLEHLRRALEVAAAVPEPRPRLSAFIRAFEDGADQLMAAQSGCLYLSVLTERQLIGHGTAEPVTRAIHAWRAAVTGLLRDALPAGYPQAQLAALADHVFVTFEGAFLLARSTGDAGNMRAQLRALRHLFEALVRPP